MVSSNIKEQAIVSTQNRRQNTSINRRDFIKRTTAAASAVFALPLAPLPLTGSAFGHAIPGWSKLDSIVFADDPFGLGVASGDPEPESVVIWTRLAPNPQSDDSLLTEKVPVRWEVALDEKMQNIVAKGTVRAAPESAHSIHVEVNGLRPSQWYWYRFSVAAGSSPVGRTKTTPPANRPNDRVNFAFASCQHYEAGYFTAYRHMAKEDLDMVFHLGDYIYEGGPTADRPRMHNGPEIISLADYRKRYALYKSDPLLMVAHASFPWGVVWDDHEVDNNYASLIPEATAPPVDFAARRRAAYQAWYEHMPVRRSTLRRGSEVQIYRPIRYGTLANFYMLDTRQYRTDQPCGDGAKAPCPESLDPRATILGPQQGEWLNRELRDSRARWNVLAQQVMMAQVDSLAGSDQRFPMDQWNGYAMERRRLLEFLGNNRISNPIVLTGDIHTNWAADLKPDFASETSPVVGTEFVGTSISTGGDGSDVRPTTPLILSENPHIKFFNAQRGYVRCSVTPSRWQTDYRIIDAITRPDANVSTRASFVVEDSRPGAKPA